MPRTSVNVPRTVVTIMCLAEKRTSVWAGSIANVAMGWFLLLGAGHRAAAAVVDYATISRYRCVVNYIVLTMTEGGSIPP